MTLSQETIEQAQELVTMLTCPWYTKAGNKQCISGCYDEPKCETNGPWLDQIVEVLTEVANLEDERATETLDSH